MENIVGRYRNVTILVAILFAQVLGLAIQVKRSAEDRPTRLIRVWTVASITPLEKGVVGLEGGVAGIWRNYLYLRGVRQQNRELKEQIEQLRLEQVRLQEDAAQARRLQTLLGFKEQFISRTVPAQVIGSSGSEQMRQPYIDKGAKDGIRTNMAVITADGVVGKVLKVFDSTSQVLLVNDQTSGVGTILEQSRLQGVLKGTPSGEVTLDKIMNDEEVQAGEKVLTSGGDQIFPKGLLVGTVNKAVRGPESFLIIKVKAAANLSKLEEVLIITKDEEKAPALADDRAPVRAVDVLAERLPSVPDKPKVDAATGQPTDGALSAPNPAAGSARGPAGDAEPLAPPAKLNRNGPQSLRARTGAVTPGAADSAPAREVAKPQPRRDPLSSQDPPQ